MEVPVINSPNAEILPDVSQPQWIYYMEFLIDYSNHSIMSPENVTQDIKQIIGPQRSHLIESMYQKLVSMSSFMINRPGLFSVIQPSNYLICFNNTNLNWRNYTEAEYNLVHGKMVVGTEFEINGRKVLIYSDPTYIVEAIPREGPSQQTIAYWDLENVDNVVEHCSQLIGYTPAIQTQILSSCTNTRMAIGTGFYHYVMGVYRNKFSNQNKNHPVFENEAGFGNVDLTNIKVPSYLGMFFNILVESLHSNLFPSMDDRVRSEIIYLSNSPPQSEQHLRQLFMLLLSQNCSLFVEHLVPFLINPEDHNLLNDAIERVETLMKFIMMLLFLEIDSNVSNIKFENELSGWNTLQLIYRQIKTSSLPNIQQNSPPNSANPFMQYSVSLPARFSHYGSNRNSVVPIASMINQEELNQDMVPESEEPGTTSVEDQQRSIFVTDGGINSACRVVLEKFWKLEHASGIFHCQWSRCGYFTHYEGNIQVHIVSHMSQSSRDMLDQGIDHHLDINSGTITCLFHGCGVTLDNMDAARRHIEEHGSLVKDLFRKCVNCHKQYNKIDSLLAHMIFQCDEKSSHQINCSCTEYWLEINN